MRLLANLLDDPEPVRPVFQRIVAEGRKALGDRFDAAWESGAAASLSDLYRIVEEA